VDTAAQSALVRRNPLLSPGAIGMDEVPDPGKGELAAVVSVIAVLADG
jgi:hypothetical protein